VARQALGFTTLRSAAEKKPGTDEGELLTISVPIDIVPTTVPEPTTVGMVVNCKGRPSEALTKFVNKLFLSCSLNVAL